MHFARFLSTTEGDRFGNDVPLMIETLALAGEPLQIDEASAYAFLLTRRYLLGRCANLSSSRSEELPRYFKALLAVDAELMKMEGEPIWFPGGRHSWTIQPISTLLMNEIRAAAHMQAMEVAVSNTGRSRGRL